MRKLNTATPSSSKRKSAITGSTTIVFWLFSMAVAFCAGSILTNTSDLTLSLSSSPFSSSSSSSFDPNQPVLKKPTTTIRTATTTTTDVDNDSSSWACSGGFFSLLVSAFVPGDQEPGACTQLYNGRYRPLLEDHSRHMMHMNALHNNNTNTNSNTNTNPYFLTLFTTWTDEQLAEEGCHLNDLPGIRTRQFDPIALLQKHGYTDTEITWMRGWRNAAYAAKKKQSGRKGLSKSERNVVTHNYSARLADIWRVLLAKEYQMAYADLDMMYLSPYPHVYLQHPNVAIPVWGEEKGAFEIQNSGFCFVSKQLDVLIRKQRELIQYKGPSQMIMEQYKLYTAMGPNLFQHAIQEMTLHGGPIQFYLTNSNDDSNIKKTVKKCTGYQLLWLHLDSRWRGANMADLREKHVELREKCLPADASGSYHNNNNNNNTAMTTAARTTAGMNDD